MGEKYSHTSGWMREIWALAVFVGGFALYDARDGGDGGDIAALLMMLGSAAFMCFAVVERMFFLPRIRRREDRSDSAEWVESAKTARNESINYDGPQVPRAASHNPNLSGSDGLDPVIPPRPSHPSHPSHPAHATPAPPEHAGAEPEQGGEDDHEARVEMESTLSDPFFGGDKK